MYVPSTEDIRTLYSHNIELYTRIDLLNDRMKTIDSLQGITTEGRISVDADADIRRTYTSTIVLDEKHAISQYSEDLHWCEDPDAGRYNLVQPGCICVQPEWIQL